MPNTAKYWLALKYVPRLACQKKLALVKKYNLVELFQLTPDVLTTIGLSSKQLSALTKPHWAKIDSIIAQCQALDIQLILAYTPEYIDGQNFISNRSEIVEMFSNYARENDLIFLDYSSDSICLDKSNFYNSMHLNRRGATKFTKKLARDLKNLGI